MSIYKYFILIVFVTLLSVASTTAQAPANIFAGTWQLNKTKTDMKDLPRAFKGYRIVVAQSESKIGIKNYVDGTIEVRVLDQNSNARGGGTTLLGSSTGDTKPGSTAGAVPADYGGSLALFNGFTPVEVAYNLDDKEMNVEILNNGQVVGNAKTKAKMEKSGKTIKLTTVRKMKTMKAGQTEIQIYIRERLDIMDDGMLKYSKTVELPSGRDDIVLYFDKAAL